MEQALQNDLVLDTIFYNFDFNTLKELRLVNKKWNEGCSRQLRKQCKLIHWGAGSSKNFQEYQELDSCLINREIVAGLPVEIWIDESITWKRKWGTEPYFWTCEIIVNAHWRNNIVKVTGFDVGGQVGNLSSFVLQYLPSLKELELVINKDYESWFETSSAQPALPEVKFEKLEYLGFSFDGWRPSSENRVSDIDLRFLRQCPSLRTMSIKSWDWPEMLLEFFERWMEIYWDHPNIRRNQKVLFQIRSNKAPGEHMNLLNAMTQFIKVNKPTSLALQGSFFQQLRSSDCNFPVFFRSLEGSDCEIQSLKTELPTTRVDWMLQLLKKFKVFSNLTELCLTITNQNVQLENDLKLGPQKHCLSKVVSLELSCDEDFWQAEGTLSLLQAAAHLPNVTYLFLNGVPLVDDTGSRMRMVEFFNSCKQFPVLRQLQVNLMILFVLGTESVTMADEKPAGCFKDLTVLDGLETFNVVIEDFPIPVSEEALLVELFHGYEPHVALSLDIMCHPVCCPDVILPQIRHKLQFNVAEFYEALLEAEARVAFQERNTMRRMNAMMTDEDEF